MSKEKTPDRITFSESVKVNIGDYESRDVFMALSTDVADDESVSDAILRAKKAVRAELYKCEKVLRSEVKSLVDFDTTAKTRK